MIMKATSKPSAGKQRAISVLFPILLISILLLATGLRFRKLDQQSFWNDEGNSARLSERSLPLIIEGTASDIHPPLYYLILRGWRELLGDSEFGLRSFSAFTGVLTVAAIMAVAQFLYRYSVPIYSDQRPGTIVSAKIGDHILSGCVNDWDF